MFFLYELVQILFYFFLMFIINFVRHEKFIRFVKLRNPFDFKKQLLKIKNENKKIIEDGNIFWFHVASAGEMEQAIPVARKLMENFDAKFFVTYYSPSAEPFLKNFPNTVVTLGLPLDIRCIFLFAIRQLNIKKIFFVRYDIWPSLFKICHKSNVEINLLSATEKKTKLGILGYLSAIWSKKYYQKMTNIFAVSREDYLYFSNIVRAKNVFLAGDAKWARAFERAKNYSDKKKEEDFSMFFSFCLAQKNSFLKKCAVFGSPHNEEHHIAINCAKLIDKLFIVYVPHDVTENHCFNLKRQYEQCGVKVMFYSEIIGKLKRDNIITQIISERINCEHLGGKKESNILKFKQESCFSNEILSGCDVLIFDKVGYLAEIYELADVAIVGGGFDGQIHNVLEPAAHGSPVLFGSKFQRAREASQLVEAGAAISFENTNELFQFLAQWVSLKEKGSDSTHPAIRLGQVRTKTIELFNSIPDTSEIILNALVKGR